MEVFSPLILYAAHKEQNLTLCRIKHLLPKRSANGYVYSAFGEWLRFLAKWRALVFPKPAGSAAPDRR